MYSNKHTSDRYRWIYDFMILEWLGNKINLFTCTGNRWRHTLQHNQARTLELSSLKNFEDPISTAKNERILERVTHSKYMTYDFGFIKDWMISRIRNLLGSLCNRESTHGIEGKDTLAKAFWKFTVVMLVHDGHNYLQRTLQEHVLNKLLQKETTIRLQASYFQKTKKEP